VVFRNDGSRDDLLQDSIVSFERTDISEREQLSKAEITLKLDDDIPLPKPHDHHDQTAFPVPIPMGSMKVGVIAPSVLDQATLAAFRSAGERRLVVTFVGD
jgi:hypothetical protein